MAIRTLEDGFEYQIKKVIKEFRESQGLQGLDAEEFQDEVLKDKTLAVEFARKMLERIAEYGGDEMFEVEEE